jgi:hypothetical protein
MQTIFPILLIFVVGFLGICLVVCFKINDLTDANPNTGFWQMVRLFIHKSQASYFSSIIALIIYTITKDDWPKLFLSGDQDVNKFIPRLLGLQTIMAFFVAGGVQYGIHKLFLKKVDAMLKIWSGDWKTGSPDVNATPVMKDVDKLKEKLNKE